LFINLERFLVAPDDAERWSENFSENVAHELGRRCESLLNK
jgi:hypothetical protein